MAGLAPSEWFHDILPAKQTRQSERDKKINCNSSSERMGGWLLHTPHDTVDEPAFQEEEWQDGFVFRAEEGKRRRSGKGVLCEDTEDEYDRERRMAGESSKSGNGNLIIEQPMTQFGEVRCDAASGGKAMEETEGRSGVQFSRDNSRNCGEKVPDSFTNTNPTVDVSTPNNEIEDWASRPRISIGPGAELDSWHTSILESLGGRISRHTITSEDSDNPQYVAGGVSSFKKTPPPRRFADNEESLNPEAHEESLRSREREVNRQQTKLLGWERRLAELQETLNKTDMSFWAREEKVKRGELDVARKEKQIKELRGSLAIKSDEVEASAKAVAEAESKLKARERLVDEREKKWEEREEALKPEEDRMTQRMLIWEENWKKLTIRDKELQSLEVRLQQRQLGLDYRETQVMEREKMIGRLPAQVQAHSRVDEKEITERTERIVAREKMVAEGEAQLKEKNDAMEKREQELQRQTRMWGQDWEVLRRREEELEANKAKWVEKWNVLALQEEELDARVAEYEQERQRFDQELATQMQDVKILEERIQDKERQLQERGTTHLAEGGMHGRTKSLLKREQAVIKRESSVLKRETAVAARESSVADRELRLMVIADRERRLEEGREWVTMPGWRQSGRQKVQIRSPYTGRSSSVMAELDIFTTGINTPTGTSVYGDDNSDVSQGAVSIPGVEEDDLLTY